MCALMKPSEPQFRLSVVWVSPLCPNCQLPLPHTIITKQSQRHRCRNCYAMVYCSEIDGLYFTTQKLDRKGKAAA